MAGARRRFKHDRRSGARPVCQPVQARRRTVSGGGSPPTCVARGPRNLQTRGRATGAAARTRSTRCSGRHGVFDGNLAKHNIGAKHAVHNEPRDIDAHVARRPWPCFRCHAARKSGPVAYAASDQHIRRHRHPKFSARHRRWRHQGACHGEVGCELVVGAVLWSSIGKSACSSGVHGGFGGVAHLPLAVVDQATAGKVHSRCSGGAPPPPTGRRPRCSKTSACALLGRRAPPVGNRRSGGRRRSARALFGRRAPRPSRRQPRCSRRGACAYLGRAPLQWVVVAPAAVGGVRALCSGGSPPPPKQSPLRPSWKKCVRVLGESRPSPWQAMVWQPSAGPAAWHLGSKRAALPCASLRGAGPQPRRSATSARRPASRRGVSTPDGDNRVQGWRHGGAAEPPLRIGMKRSCRRDQAPDGDRLS